MREARERGKPAATEIEAIELDLLGGVLRRGRQDQGADGRRLAGLRRSHDGDVARAARQDDPRKLHPRILPGCGPGATVAAPARRAGAHAAKVPGGGVAQAVGRPTAEVIEQLESDGKALVFYPDDMRIQNTERNLQKLKQSFNAGMAQTVREWDSWMEFLQQ